jgi:hypothetical protein
VNKKVFKPALFWVLILGLTPSVSFAVQKKCDTPSRGRYVNFEHGYSFTVPKGYGGQWQSPCAYDEKLHDCICIGNHGLYIAITNTSSINVFSAYPVEFDEERPAQARILASMVATERKTANQVSAISFQVQSVQVRTNWARRVSLTWVDAASNRKMKKVSYQLVTRVQKIGGESAEVTVSLVAPEDEFDARVPLLREVLESFKWLRD